MQVVEDLMAGEVVMVNASEAEANDRMETIKRSIVLLVFSIYPVVDKKVVELRI